MDDGIHDSVLDLSFNLLRAVPDGLGQLQELCTLYFVQNRISTISNLEFSVNLRSLELGGNKIRVCTNKLLDQTTITESS